MKTYGCAHKNARALLEDFFVTMLSMGGAGYTCYVSMNTRALVSMSGLDSSSLERLITDYTWQIPVIYKLLSTNTKHDSTATTSLLD